MAGKNERVASGPSTRDLTRVRLTNLNRVMFPAANITKKDIIAYYIRIAPRMLPFLAQRPLTMHRYPGGVEEEAFYEKDAPGSTPDYVERFTHWSGTARRDIHFVLCNNLDTLIWLANLASLELHVTLSCAGTYDSLDLMLLDIDPEPPVAFDDVIDTAHSIRHVLENRNIRSYVKTSGKKGLHILIPLLPGYRFDEIRAFAHEIGETIAKETSYVVAEFSRSRDAGTIFIDYLQNARGKTMAAPYSLRGTPGANVSAPLSWEDLRHGISPEDFNIKTILLREEEPWRGIFEHRQRIGK